MVPLKIAVKPKLLLTYVALVILLPIVVKTPEMVVPRVVIVATAASAMRHAINAYSIRSCPDSSFTKFEVISLKRFIAFLLRFFASTICIDISVLVVQSWDTS